MSMDIVRETITETFKTEFGAAYPAIKVKYENVRFERPANAAWVSLDILEGPSRSIAIGGIRSRHCGVINVQVMVPEDTGTKTLNEMCDRVLTIFKDRTWSLTDGKLWTFGADKRSRPPMNGFAQRSVQFEFYRDSR